MHVFVKVECLKEEAKRECKAAQDSITTTYKLELMKMPKHTKEMSWDDYCAQVLNLYCNLYLMTYCQNDNTGGLPISNAVAEALEDSVLEVVDSKVSHIKSTMKNKRKGKENKGSVVKSSRKGPNTSLVTPKHLPPRQAKTPMITPKFDTSKAKKTLSRAAKEGEVLVSLSGKSMLFSVKHFSLL